MASRINPAREMAIASRKRPASPDSSGSESDESLDASPSDFEFPKRPTKKPVKKNKIAATSSPIARHEPVPKIPGPYQSLEGNALFSTKWYKEVTKRDDFWQDFKKRVPKAVISKRFRLEVLVDFSGETGAEGNRARSKTRKALTSKAGSTNDIKITSTNANKIIGTRAAIESVGDDARQVRLKSNTAGGGAVEIGDTANGTFAKPTGIANATKIEGDDIAKAIADVNTPSEVREMMKRVRADEERCERVIAMQNEERKKLEMNRQKRAAAKERKIAREAEERRIADLMTQEGVGNQDIGHKDDGTEIRQEASEQSGEDKAMKPTA